MKKLENYTEQEWELVSSLPQLVGISMSGIAASGVVGTTKEAMANSKTLREGKEKYPNNHLIQAMLPNMESLGDAMDDAKQMRQDLIEKIKSNQVKDGESLAEIVMQDAEKAMDILESKEDSNTVEEFKNWLLEIAHNVANAGTEGDILGFGGTQYSKKEKELYQRLKDSLS